MTCISVRDVNPFISTSATSHGRRSWKDRPTAKAIAATISLLLITGNTSWTCEKSLEGSASFSTRATFYPQQSSRRIGDREKLKGTRYEAPHRFAEMTPDKRPQDPHMDGTGLRLRRGSRRRIS
jgi:hypothetical protein